MSVPGSPIDRVAPTIRPDRRVVMFQKWRTLLFLHWELPPELLAACLPRGLELDLHEGKAYVGLVPFTMRGIRPVGLTSVPWLSSFHETNVRTYVHVNGRDPGVWFFSLDAANPVGVALARALFHLPYYYARMSLTRAADGVATRKPVARKPTAKAEPNRDAPVAPKHETSSSQRRGRATTARAPAAPVAVPDRGWRWWRPRPRTRWRRPGPRRTGR